MFANSPALEKSDQVFRIHPTAPPRTRYRLKPGMTVGQVSFDNLFYADIARESGVPPFVIFHDRALKEMAALRPTTPEALLQVNGVGEAKLKRYGSRFLDAIREAVEGPIAKENLG